MSLFVSLPPVFLLLLLCGGLVLDANGLTINSPQELINFANRVNSELNYPEDTVYLGSDIDFSLTSSHFEPIGNDSLYHFKGFFDGQGYTISNLVVNTSFESAGLFGRSLETTIKNVVMDNSCSVVISYTYTSNVVDGGSITGYCDSCNIEGVVNMASIAFTGSVTGSLYIGGIVGRALNIITIRNCVNYGSLMSFGIVEGSGSILNGNTHIGGIVGMLADEGIKSIQNCLNYGTLTYSGTSPKLYLGGIIGSNWAGNANIENCLSAGKLINTTQASKNNYIGSVVGYIFDAETNTKHSFLISDTGCDTAYGFKNAASTATTVVADSPLTELNATTLNALNEYAKQSGGTMSSSLMLHLNGGTVNNINQETLIIIAQKNLPETLREGYTFLFWCPENTTECAGKYVPGTTDLSTLSELHAQWRANNYNVTFDPRGGNVSQPMKEVTYDDPYGELPYAEKAGYSFTGWFTKENEESERITNKIIVKITENQTLYAHWTVNNYTVTFNVTGGHTTESSREVTYDDKYGTFPDAWRIGYSFTGWFTKENGEGEEITNETTISIPYNHTLYACWIANNYTVTFNATGGHITEETKEVTYDDPYGELPKPTRDGYSFTGWFATDENGGELAIGEESIVSITDDLTVYAKWTLGVFTITFNATGGIASQLTKEVTYTEFYGDLPDAKKEGYKFDGWFTNEKDGEGEEINNDTVVETTENQTLYAHWTANNYTRTEFVEIVFGRNDMSEEEINFIINEYANFEFTIVKFDSNEDTGHTTVIIKFNDLEAAENFVETITASSEIFTANSIIRVNFITEPIGSSSASLCLDKFFGIFI